MSLIVNFKFSKDSWDVEYVYDTASFFDTAIDQVHNIATSMVKNVISGKDKKFNKEEYFNESDTDDEKAYKIEAARKALILKNSEIFPSRSTDELLELAGQCTIRCYSINDTVMNEKCTVDNIGIVAEGIVSETHINRKGKRSTVQLYAKNKTFLLETLCENNVSEFELSVESDSAKILWVPREELIDFLNLKPTNWLEIVNALSMVTTRIKRLWTIE